MLYYLEDSDINEEGNFALSSIKPGVKAIVVMIKSNGCGHCSVALPAFEELAEKHGHEYFVVVCQADGKDKVSSETIKKVGKKTFRGYPHYTLFTKDGKNLENEENEGRGVEDLVKFAKKAAK